MNLQILPGKLSGNVVAIESKSHAQRVMLASVLTSLTSSDNNISDIISDIKIRHNSEDIRAAQDCLKQLENEYPHMDCIESGATLRFLLPVTMALKNKAVFSGTKRLMERPLIHLESQMSAHGCEFTRNEDNTSITVTGNLQPGEYKLPGNISTQYITGLLFALPLLDGNSTIEITTELQSFSYLDLTINVLEAFGIEISQTTIPVSKHLLFKVKGNQKYLMPFQLPIEGDWSNIAVWLTANSIGSSITCQGININSKQGDKVILDILATYDNIGSPYDKGEPIIVDASASPDLIPVVAVKAGLTPRVTRIINAEKLAFKESNRLASTLNMLSVLGANVRETPDGLIIKGIRRFDGGKIDSANDHRIVMAAAIAATASRRPVVITHAEAVKKSYPDFFNDFISLGGRVRIQKTSVK